ncbi:MAG TPA: right-handed parallel beta-helix repeat-containing protein, partial [Polyangia bacterium]|nr:right-handed parallel beta-helix repeat-containing protein [Polyangia bacterium]
GGSGGGGTAGADAGVDATGGSTSVTDGGADADASDADATDGGCATICTLGASRCGPTGGIQTCGLDANSCPIWSVEASCGQHSTCASTGSSVACQCNTSTCQSLHQTGPFCSGGNAITTCAVDGDGCYYATGAAVDCGTHQSCKGTAGNAFCDCNVDPNCGSETATFCPTTSTKSTCAKDTNGCLYVASTVTCPSHTSCTGSNPTGDCTCDPTPTGCTATGGTFCSNSNGSVTTCSVDGNHCVFIDHASACGEHQTCSGPNGTASCGCNTTPAACPGGGAGNACTGGNSIHCSVDAQSCVYIDATNNCGQNQFCDGSSGTCKCNADPAGCSQTGTFCDGSGNLATCQTDVNGCHVLAGAPAACPSVNQTCTGSLPNAACSCNAAPAACGPNGKAGSYCNGSTDVVTCTADAQSCVTVASTKTCGTHQSCGGTTGSNSCVCNAPSDPTCTAGGTFCSGTGSQSTCTVDTDSCPFVSATTACPTHESCKGTGIGTACSCDNTCTVGQLGTYCTDATHVNTCADDPNTCHIAGTPTACTGTRTCQGADGSGACLCRTVGTVAGTGCTTAGATLCQGDTVLTCTGDGTGCNTWVAGEVCTTTGFVCGTKSGVAACQCPENATGNAYVDPVNGSDAASGKYPTGLNSPTVCRFASITKGLTVATSSGNQVIATGGGGTFSSETFPLVVNPGVIVTTSDLPLTPANYTIAFNGAGSAVSLSTGSIFEGFTIANNGGNGSSSAISVTGAGALVSHVALEGTGGTTLANGIAVFGSGQASVDNATVSGFSTGIAVSSTASSTTSLTGPLTVSGNTSTNIALSSGSLTATTVTVAGGGATGIAVSAGAGVTSTFTGNSLTVSGNTGAGMTQSVTSTGSATINFNSGSLDTNGGGGLVQSGGAASFGSVDVHDNTGAGLTLSGGTVTLGATTVEKNTTRGLSMSGGTLNVGAATITNNTTDGLNASAGAINVATGAVFTKNGGTGITSGGTLTFGGAAATPISVTNNTGDGVSITAGSLTANYLTLDSNGTGATKASGLKIGGAAAISLGTASDAALLFQNNGLHGVNINGTTSASNIDMRKVQSKTNGGDGVLVDLNGGTTSPGAIASITNVTASGNTGNGVEVVRAPLVASVVKLTLDTLTVSSNGGVGVWLRGSTGNVGALLKNSKISGNTGVGLRAEATLVTATTQETIQTNDITGNGGGGIVFGSRDLLNSFVANTIHGNTGDQILVSAGQSGGGNWNFRSPGLTCDTNSNKVWCYGTGVGIRLTANATTVDAENMGWANSGPSSGIDYVAAATSSILAGTPCTATTTCP